MHAVRSHVNKPQALTSHPYLHKAGPRRSRLVRFLLDAFRRTGKIDKSFVKAARGREVDTTLADDPQEEKGEAHDYFCFLTWWSNLCRRV